MLDRLKPALRHFLIMLGAMLLAALLTELKADLGQLLPMVFKGLPAITYSILVVVLAPTLTTGILYFTKLTKQYGVGATPAAPVPDPQAVTDAPIVGDPVNDTGANK